MPESKVSKVSRPAHRPSRRHQLIEGAVELFAVKPPELVTIAEIVRHVEMTPAAFYYHFSSRDELFHEVVSVFGEDWASDAEQWWGEATDLDGVLAAARALLDKAIDRRAHATVFFVTSKGMSVAIEESRQSFAARASIAAAAAVARSDPARSAARAAVGGVGLMTVLESSLRAELSLDSAYRTLGPRQFHDEVERLCRRVVTVSPGGTTQ
jgi:AcrR family transcriptional regulator